jgi:ribonuclease HI
VIEVYSDGASGARGGKPGGYGWIICKDGFVKYSGYGGHPSTTNNAMEMTGAIEGLRALECSKIVETSDEVHLISDSQYVLGIAGGHSNPVKNMELAQALRARCRRLGVIPRHVKGHSFRQGLPVAAQWDAAMNHMCDKLAGMGKRQAAKTDGWLFGSQTKHG